MSKEKTNLRPMRFLCKLGFHSFTDKPYNRTYLECWHCKSVLPGYKRVWLGENGKPTVENGYSYGAYTLEKETEE